MASVTAIWGGLMGPKSEYVRFSLVLPLLFEGWRAAGGRQENEMTSEPWRLKPQSRTEQMRLFIKSASCRSSELCFLFGRGGHFHKNHENMPPKNGRYCPNHVGYIKISPEWGRMHQDVIKIMSDALLKSFKEAICTNNTHICDFFSGAAWGAWSG